MSQTQELERIYNKLGELNPGVDLQELIYGVGGYYYSIFPTEWNQVFAKYKGVTAPLTDSNRNSKSGFAGDPVYSERLWEDFKAWALMNRGIEVKDFSSYKEEDDLPF